MDIVIGSDHAGFELKQNIIRHFKNKINFIDVGASSVDSVDYPDYAHSAAEKINQNISQKAILICGSGNGIQMTANKHQKIRCALCWNEEIAILARSHNDANSIALPARFVSTDQAIQIVSAFLNTTFEGGRHERRKDKISCV
jgi:ribose 5-phosphate isomerase B